MLALSLLVSLELSSCGPVIFEHPLATAADTVWRGVWEGVWIDTMDDRTVVRVDFDSPKGARFFISDSASVSEYGLRPVRIGRRWFADLYPLSVTRTKRPITALELSADSLGYDISDERFGITVSADSLKMEFLPERVRTYLVFKLEIDKTGLILAYLSDAYIDEVRNAHPEALPTEPDTISDGEDKLTSSPAEIRRFLERYGDVDSLFSPLDPMTRQR
jgi:hypothetical protein